MWVTDLRDHVAKKPEVVGLFGSWSRDSDASSPYAFLGCYAEARLNATAELRFVVVLHAKSRGTCVVSDHGIGGKHGIVYAESVSNAWLQSRIL